MEKVIGTHINWIGKAGLVGLLLCSATGNASNSTRIIKGPSSLKVKVVDHRGRPVQGALIVLYVFRGHTEDHTNEQQELSRYQSNGSGEVIIDKLPAGSYQVILSETVIRFFEDSFYLDVTKQSHGQGEFVFHWPPQERVIVTSTLSGTLYKWETAAGSNGLETSVNRGRGLGKTLPIASTDLSLFRFFSGEKVAEAKTDEDGRFDLKVSESGLYYMRFGFGGSQETVVLDLDRDFVGAAPVIDILVDDVIINSDAPQYRSLNGGVIHDPGAQH